MRAPIRGVVAAIATPVTAERKPDISRFLTLANHLLDNGCDGLNVLGTTGEATSFSRAQRMEVMLAAAKSLDASRLMAGTGAASLDDACALTRHAGELGFGAALVLPPFYYKGVSDDGVIDYIGALAAASAPTATPIFLYNYPALSGVPYTLDLVGELIRRFPDRVLGLKDSSGDLAYERALAARHPGFAVFPANEATLLEGRGAGFAGCVSATANLNSDLCGKAWRDGDAAALDTAMRVRKLFDGKPLVAGVKAGLAAIHGDPALSVPMPPLTAWGEADAAALARDMAAARLA